MHCFFEHSLLVSVMTWVSPIAKSPAIQLHVCLLISECVWAHLGLRALWGGGLDHDLQDSWCSYEENVHLCWLPVGYSGASIPFVQECQVSSLSVPSSWTVEASLPLLTEHTAWVFVMGDGIGWGGCTNTFLKIISELERESQLLWAAWLNYWLLAISDIPELQKLFLFSQNRFL